MSLRNDERRADDGKGMWEQINELLRDAVLPPPSATGEIEEPTGDELRAANLLERSVEPIACAAQSQAAYAAETLRHASIVDEEGTREHRHQAVAALKAGRFLREIITSELGLAAGRLNCAREQSVQSREIQELLDGTEGELRKDPDYVPDDPPRVLTEAGIEAVRCEISELEEVVAHWEKIRDGVDALVARVWELNPRAAIAFDREDRSGSVS